MSTRPEDGQPAATSPDRVPPAADSLAIEAGAKVAGLDPQALVDSYGSPLYVYDAAVLRARVSALRAALPKTTELAYAVKANPSPSVLSVMAGTGLGADIASGGELRAVERAGFEPERVVFTGPGKTDAELRAALRARVRALTIESLDELAAQLSMAGEARPGQGLMLRLATEGEAEGLPIISAPGNVKFGLTDAEAEAAIGQLRAAGALEPDGPFVLRGFHAFGASNVRHAIGLVEGAAGLARRASAIAERLGLVIELLDAGGGLGIPYGPGEAALDIEALGAGLRDEQARWRDQAALREARLLLEPGRWLAGPAGVYLCRVIRTKERDGRVVAISDGGVHHLLRPRLVGQDHRVVPVGAAAGRIADARMDLVGPLCTGLDILAADVSVPRPSAGDLHAVLDAGAYGYSESMPLFLSHPLPAEIMVEGGTALVSRARVEPD